MKINKTVRSDQVNLKPLTTILYRQLYKYSIKIAFLNVIQFNSEMGTPTPTGTTNILHIWNFALLCFILAGFSSTSS